MKKILTLTWALALFAISAPAKELVNVSGASGIAVNGYDMARNGALARAARIWQSAKRLRDAATATG